MHCITFLRRVVAQAGLHGLWACATAHTEKPGSTGRLIVLQLDERWHALKTRQQKFWLWTALDEETG
jgi:hypothetical protein